jgi:HEAT repeat protein
MAMGDWGDREAFDFLLNELKDRELPLRIRRVVLTALTRIDTMKSLPQLVSALGHSDVSVQETAAELLGEIGQPALKPVLLALQNPTQENGALLALQKLPMPPEPTIEEYTSAEVERAVDYDKLMRSLKSDSHSEAVALLVESLQKKSNEHGIRALRAIGLLGDRDAMNLSIEILASRNSAPLDQRLCSIRRRQTWSHENGKYCHPVFDGTDSIFQACPAF